MSSDASSRPPSTAATATSLAPGFRFHPTDEELVSYYLKRKILAKPLRVDAISEVDLYKSEPWDLPGKSRIRSRDVEWYFFSPLDKKYSNRSRTNRTTGHGYWKTTGKDRPVRKGTRVVGMKKTLVFHAGRAPKGERSNWVMHEYRLEDEELAQAGVVQDGYVVCRIFQKSGAGPQNGAQYGAPFVEEEWENDDDMMLLNAEELVLGSGDQQRTLSNDFEHERKTVDIKNENEEPPEIADDGLNVYSPMTTNVHPGGPSSFPVEAHENQEFVHAGNQNVNMPEPHDSQNLFGLNENFDISAWHQRFPEDDYLELNDFTNSSDVGYSSIQETFIGMRNDQGSSTVPVQVTNLQELHGVEEFFNSPNENADFPEAVEAFPPYEDKFYLDGGSSLAENCQSGEKTDNSMVLYHDPSDSLPTEHDCFFEMNDFLDPPDKIDEILAFFDATEDNLHHSCLENSERIDSSALGPSHIDRELDESNVQSQAALGHTGNEVATKMPLVDDEPSYKGDEYSVKQGSLSEKGWDKTITGRLVGFLGSISSPPALAAEYPRREGKAIDFNSSAQSSSSIHITAGMIHVNGLTMRKTENLWPAQKNEEMGFLLSYSMAKSDSASNLGKMHVNAISLMIRSGFCLSFFSILCLVISYKIGICVCTR